MHPGKSAPYETRLVNCQRGCQPELWSAPADEEVHDIEDLVLVGGRDQGSDLLQALQEDSVAGALIEHALHDSSETIAAFRVFDRGQELVSAFAVHG
ncbi:hypothetical protein ACFWUU_23860 [Kribbella sp. NPDC058693]|uniref:hypothetical protein n=1 Tax=Kribbella sp. NPDC058693 TaxID=3346602 RepID=UPI003651BF9A